MIVGSGLIASALADVPGCIIYAAGVSNPTCTDPAEYKRDKTRLQEALKLPGRLIYISTCSQADSAYVRHKHAMDALVMDRGNSLVCRLPTVAARSDNPHTLLNWLWHKVTTGETFDLWAKAMRNIIELDDAAFLIETRVRGNLEGGCSIIGPANYSAIELVRSMERLSGKKANYVLRDIGDAVQVPDLDDGKLDEMLRRYYP